MIKAFNSIKEIFLVFYQVLFVEAKERYEITEFYLEECGHNKKMETVLKVKDSQTQQNIINGLKKGKTINQASASIKKDKKKRNFYSHKDCSYSSFSNSKYLSYGYQGRKTGKTFKYKRF